MPLAYRVFSLDVQCTPFQNILYSLFPVTAVFSSNSIEYISLDPPFPTSFSSFRPHLLLSTSRFYTVSYLDLTSPVEGSTNASKTESET